MLRNELSFCIYSADGDEIKPEDIEKQQLKRTVTIGDCIDSLAGSNGFSFDDKPIIEEEEEDLFSHFSGTTPPRSSFETGSRLPSPPMYLATGLGINDGDFIVGNMLDLNSNSFEEEGDLEEYYRDMLFQYPFHPLLLRNYAQLLQNKGDLHAAVEYYYRATLADPNDAEVLLQYAKLIWELEHDQETTQSYFDQAIQIAPQDSNIFGAYASFLWDCDDDE